MSPERVRPASARRWKSFRRTASTAHAIRHCDCTALDAASACVRASCTLTPPRRHHGPASPANQGTRHCRSGPANRFRSARTGMVTAPTSPSSPKWPRASSSVSSTRPATNAASDSLRSRRSAGTATSPVSVPGSGTAFACTARGRPADGHRCNPAKLLLDPYARAIAGRRGPRSGAAPVCERRRTRYAASDSRQRALRSTLDRGRPAFRLGRRSSAPSSAARNADLRDPRQRLLRAAAGDSRRSCAAPTPRWRIRPPSSTSRRLGITAVELLPVHQFVHDGHLVERGSPQLLGLQLDRLLCAARRVCGRRRHRRAGRRVQADGAGAPCRRHRSHPRRRLQPHRRRQSPRSDAVAERTRQRGLLPDRGRRTAVSTWTTPAPATA